MSVVEMCKQMIMMNVRLQGPGIVLLNERNQLPISSLLLPYFVFQDFMMEQIPVKLHRRIHSTIEFSE